MFDVLASVSHRAARSNDKRIGRHRGFFDALGQHVLVFDLKPAAYFVTGVMALLAEAPHTLSDILISGFLAAAAFWSRSKAECG